jgi:hypothetical protein
MRIICVNIDDQLSGTQLSAYIGKIWRDEEIDRFECIYLFIWRNWLIDDWYWVI